MKNAFYLPNPASRGCGGSLCYPGKNVSEVLELMRRGSRVIRNRIISFTNGDTGQCGIDELSQSGFKLHFYCSGNSILFDGRFHHTVSSDIFISGISRFSVWIRLSAIREFSWCVPFFSIWLRFMGVRKPSTVSTIKIQCGSTQPRDIVSLCISETSRRTASFSSCGDFFICTESGVPLQIFQLVLIIPPRILRTFCPVHGESTTAASLPVLLELIYAVPPFDMPSPSHHQQGSVVEHHFQRLH